MCSDTSSPSAAITTFARAVALRDHRSYSVLLGEFCNEGYEQTVTLAQVFWFKDPRGQPERFHAVAESALTIEHFSGFGSDVNSPGANIAQLPAIASSRPAVNVMKRMTGARSTTAPATCWVG